MRLRDKAVFLAVCGFAMGVPLGLFLTVLTANGVMTDYKMLVCAPEFTDFIGNPIGAFVVEMLFSGLMGAIPMGLTVVYDIEKWSILRATVTHFVITVFEFYSICFFLHWMTLESIIEILIMTVMFIVIYFIIWLSQYLSFKRQIRAINEELLVRKSKEDSDEA